MYSCVTTNTCKLLQLKSIFHLLICFINIPDILNHMISLYQICMRHRHVQCLKARGWCGYFCYAESISPSQRCCMHITWCLWSYLALAFDMTSIKTKYWKHCVELSIYNPIQFDFICCSLYFSTYHSSRFTHHYKFLLSTRSHTYLFRIKREEHTLVMCNN